MTRNYVLKTPTGAVIMNETAYPTEDLFQHMLAGTTQVLSGDEINPAAPRRWAFVAREVAVPDMESGSGRWSLDLLYLDQDSIPTLIEVKRSTDPRIRREVVGQMLDYAANAVVYWPARVIRHLFEQRCQREGLRADEEIALLLGVDLDDEAGIAHYWDQVDSNLKGGKIRLLFVADRVPPELQRIVEFLNEQMESAEVLAVEVRRYADDSGYELFVPSVLGRTAAAQAIKESGVRSRTLWDEDSYYTNMAERLGDEAVATTRAIIAGLQAQGMQAFIGGQGKVYGSTVFVLEHGGHTHRPLVIYGDGAVEVRFNHILEHAPFAQRERRQEILDRLNAIPGLRLPAARLDSRPNFRIELLSNSDNLTTFLAVWLWYADEIRAQQPTTTV
ncbi:MAG: hypothetical protein V9E85_13735 [Candidatus Nanopelagicales bacterium]